MERRLDNCWTKAKKSPSKEGDLLVRSSRFERETCPLGGGRSIQLSYERAAGSIAAASRGRPDVTDW